MAGVDVGVGSPAPWQAMSRLATSAQAMMRRGRTRRGGMRPDLRSDFVTICCRLESIRRVESSLFDWHDDTNVVRTSCTTRSSVSGAGERTMNAAGPVND